MDIGDFVGGVFGLGFVGLMALGIGSCVNQEFKKGYPDPATYRYSEHKVEQVFRDHNGFRTYEAGEDGRLIERKYIDANGRYHGPLSKQVIPDDSISSKFTNIDSINDYAKDVEVYRDLEPGEMGHAKVLDFDTMAGTCGRIAEIHLPSDAKLSPGNETYGGKYKTHSQMGEVK